MTWPSGEPPAPNGNPYAKPSPPKSDPNTPAPTDQTSQLSENGTAIPIAYGTVRVAGNLIERSAYTFVATGAAVRAVSTSYNLGDIRSNFGNLYLCTTSPSGTTGTGDGPSGTGSGQVDGGVTWDYVKMGYRHFAAIAFCEGQIYGAGKGWQDKNVVADFNNLPHDSFWLTLNIGTPSGGRVSPIWFPIQTDVYGNTAVLFAALATGSDADLPNTSLEIKGIFTDATHVEANPADIATDLLTHTRRGVGWPAARVDSVSTGGGAASWRTYCTAAGLELSWLIDAQTSTLELLAQLLDVTMTQAVWTNRPDGLGGMLKFVPLCDQQIVGSVTYTPALTAVYNLGPNDFLDTIRVEIRDPDQIFNSHPVEYVDRATDYKRITVDDPDMSDVDLRGLRRTSTMPIPMVLSPTAAVMLSRNRAQRALNVVNTYTFRLAWKYILLEPTDVVTLTDPVLGISNKSVRIISIEEDEHTEGQSAVLTVVAEEFPSGHAAAPGWAPQTNDGLKPTVATANDELKVLPGRASTRIVADSTSTRGGSVDNLWPNPTSEISPPDGFDTTTAEWSNRFHAGAGAYAGDWTRRLTGPISTLSYFVPAAPGETFYFEAQAKAVVAGANKGGFIQLGAFDKTGALIGSSYVDSAHNDTASWVKQSISLVMPAATTQVRLLLVSGSDAAASVDFDSLYARRSIGGPVIGDGTAWFGQMWAAVANVDLNGGSLAVNNSVNIASYGAGATYNTKASVRLTWSTPPAAFAPSGTVYPLVTAQAAYGGNISGRRLVPVGLIGSPPTAVDLQLFESNGSSTAPVVLTGLEVFHVHILFVASTPGYSL